VADWGGLENRCGPQGPPWVRIPPPPLVFWQRKKKPDNSTCQVFLILGFSDDRKCQSPEGLSPARRMRRIKDMVNKPAPIRRMVNDCQISGLKTGEMTRDVLSMIW
jgi:hypothetical protein